MKFYDIDSIENIYIYGRRCNEAKPLSLMFNGSGFEVCTDASELWMEIESSYDIFEPWIAYEINGAFMGRMSLMPGEHKICLFRNMEEGVPKTVRVYRELQVMYEDEKCRLTVRGLWTTGRFLPVSPKVMRIEFIGDSITSGEGTYGDVSDNDWIPMYMSFSRCYANFVSKALTADYQVVSQGGYGVYCGWDNDIRHNMPAVYEDVLRKCDRDFNPDYIIINLGTNDESAFRQPPFTNPADGKMYKQRLNSQGDFEKEDAQKITNAVIDFMKVLRENNPKAHLLWVYGMLGKNLSGCLNNAVNRYKESMRDENVHYMDLPDTEGDKFGAHMHPGLKAHEEVSEILVEYIKNRM